MERLEKFTIPNFNKGLNKLVHSYDIDITHFSDTDGIKVDVNKVKNMKLLEDIKDNFLPGLIDTNYLIKSFLGTLQAGWCYAVATVTSGANPYATQIIRGNQTSWTAYGAPLIDVNNSEYVMGYNYRNGSFVMWGAKKLLFPTYISVAPNLSIGYAQMGISTPTFGFLNTPANMKIVDMEKYMNFLFLVLYNVYGDTYCRTLRWSDYNNPDVWTGGQSGSIDFDENIIALKPLGNYLIIYCTNSIWRMSYVGLPTIFSRERISNTIGALHYPNLWWSSRNFACDIIDFEDKHYFVSDPITKDVFVFDGVKFTPIGLPIKDIMFSLLNTETLSATGDFNYGVFGELNTLTTPNEIVFIIKNGSGFLDLFFYNTLLNSWSYGRYTLPTDYLVMLNISPVTMPQNVIDVCFLKNYGNRGFKRLDTPSTSTSTGSQYLETKIMDFGKPENYKRLQRLHLFFPIVGTTADTITVYASDDINKSFTSYGPYSVTPSSYSKYVDLDITARFFKLRYKLGANNQLTKIDFYFITRSIV